MATKYQQMNLLHPLTRENLRDEKELDSMTIFNTMTYENFGYLKKELDDAKAQLVACGERIAALEAAQESETS